MPNTWTKSVFHMEVVDVRYVDLEAVQSLIETVMGGGGGIAISSWVLPNELKGDK